MECAIDTLPPEVLHNVFSKLSASERINASLVCKKWLEVLNYKSLLKDITVLINDNNNVPVFTSMTRDFLNFKFKFIIVDNKYYELFRRFSPHIECISFENCEVWRKETTMFEDLRYDNLKVLSIIDCDLWTLFPCLPNLKELYLTGNSTITDEGIAVLQKTMKHLEVFSLLSFVSCEKKVIKRFYTQYVTYDMYPSPLILTFPAVLSFISERARTLREIRLCHEITPTVLKELASIKELCLYKIYLSSNYQCTENLIELFKNHLKLKAITLHSVAVIDEKIIDAICLLLPDIEEIVLKSHASLDFPLNQLFQLKNLNKLDIGGINVISDTFTKAILGFESYRLKSLNLSHTMYKAKEIGLELLFQKCVYLVYLDISNNKIPDTVIHSISKNLVHLEYLSLKHCHITDYGLTGQTKEHLLEETDEKCHPSLSNLKNLIELNLNDCGNITDTAVIDTIKFQYLEILHVNGCNLKVNTIKKLLQQNPYIKKIIWDDDSMENPKILRKDDLRFDEFVNERFVRYVSTNEDDEDPFYITDEDDEDYADFI